MAQFSAIETFCITNILYDMIDRLRITTLKGMCTSKMFKGLPTLQPTDLEVTPSDVMFENMFVHARTICDLLSLAIHDIKITRRCDTFEHKIKIETVTSENLTKGLEKETVGKVLAKLKSNKIKVSNDKLKDLRYEEFFIRREFMDTLIKTRIEIRLSKKLELARINLKEYECKMAENNILKNVQNNENLLLSEKLFNQQNAYLQQIINKLDKELIYWMGHYEAQAELLETNAQILRDQLIMNNNKFIEMKTLYQEREREIKWESNKRFFHIYVRKIQKWWRGKLAVRKLSTRHVKKGGKKRKRPLGKRSNRK